jgi:hypothetical protein
MKAKCIDNIGATDDLTVGCIYEVLTHMSSPSYSYIVRNDSGRDRAFLRNRFQIVNESDEAPTIPAPPRTDIHTTSQEKPQWMVSRDATLNANECFCGHPFPCDYHSA